MCHVFVSCGDAPLPFLGLHAATGSESWKGTDSNASLQKGLGGVSSPALTLPYVPSCSSGSSLFPDCLFSELNYANTSLSSIHGNQSSSPSTCIPQPVLWQKRPTQVTIANKDIMTERLPCALGHRCLSVGPIFSTLLCGWGKGVAGHSRGGFLIYL